MCSLVALVGGAALNVYLEVAETVDLSYIPHKMKVSMGGDGCVA